MSVSRSVCGSLLRRVTTPVLSRSFPATGHAWAGAVSASQSSRAMTTYTTASEVVVCNESITCDQMRVVFTDPTNGKNKHEILPRKKALALAKSYDLDLVLISPDAVPPVCKIIKVGQVLQEIKLKEKEKRQNQKAQALKEMTMTVGIDLHDFNTKMGKVKSFLSEGHPVKISLMSKKRLFSKAALAREGRNTVTTSISDLQDATMQIFMSLESLPVMVQQSDFHIDVRCPPGTEGAFLTQMGQFRVKVHQRRDFMVTAKSTGVKKKETN